MKAVEYQHIMEHQVYIVEQELQSFSYYRTSVVSGCWLTAPARSMQTSERRYSY